jgi:hypothetical protein
LKKITAIFFCAVYVFANTEFSELLKTGAFISHFAEHKNINTKLTLFQFIDMHYLGNDLNDDDNDKDMKLPFKDCHCAAFQAPAVVMSNAVSFSFPPKPVFADNRLFLYDHTSLPSSYLSDIWQPPRQAC